MSEIGILTITTLKDARLATTRRNVQNWTDILHAINEFRSAPTLFQLSRNEGTLLYMMLDGDLVHLSVFDPPELCHYLTYDESEGLNGYVDLGWNSYPAWSVVRGVDRVLDIAKLFVEQHRLASDAQWREEVLDL